MSLIAEVTVNYDAPVGLVTIQRIKGGTGADDVNTYRYRIYKESTFPNDGRVQASGDVTHRYGDGGLRLLLKVLLDAERHL